VNDQGVDIERLHREEIRWRVLKVLDAGRPGNMPETMILRAVQDAALAATPSTLRRELGYLEDRMLVKITGRDSMIWVAELSRTGVDVVEYTIDCQAGIARPPKWY